MKKNFFLAILLLTGCVQGNTSFNGSLEQLDKKGNPLGWGISSINEQNTAYTITLDSTIKEDGKYSLSIKNKNNNSRFGSVHYAISKTFSGREIELRGYLKLKDVDYGFAGLWLRVDGRDGTLAFDNMQKLNLRGTANWKEYVIKMPYNDKKAIKITFGGLLIGSGQIWMDGFRLYIDGKSIDHVAVKTIKQQKTQTDTTFQKSSALDLEKVNVQEVTNLALLCQVWGFLKYHHSDITRGNYNMDAELFRVLPEITASRNNAELSDKIEKWVDKFGKPQFCLNCLPDTTFGIAKKPNYGDIFNIKILKLSLVEKLRYIQKNGNRPNPLGAQNSYSNYYANIKTNSVTVNFSNELPYNQMEYQDTGYRLLCLFRYWNIIQYFFPYKNLIDKDWNTILKEFIPKFINANNETDYTLSVLSLINTLHDTHANIWSQNSALENYRGPFKLPFIAKFIENKLVVTGFYINSDNVSHFIRRGDIIIKIDGENISTLIKKYLPITPASNYSTQLRDLPKSYLLRSKKKELHIELISNGKKKSLNLKTIDIKCKVDSTGIPPKKPYVLIANNIGYLFCGKYKNSALPQIEKLFKNTKGIIVDMRCYPSDFMPFTFVSFIKSGNAPFADAFYPNIFYPGLFKFGRRLYVPPINGYKGKVVVIVNEETQSQAEYTTMAFQSSPNVIILGSQTAGADGDVSSIILPGGIVTMISGLGVRYPDGTETQRKGVKINCIVKPTVDGIKKGKDELLDKAEKIIENN